MAKLMQSAARREFNGSSHGKRSFITEGHKAVFLAMTGGEPNFVLTSVYVNGTPGVAIALISPPVNDGVEFMPCFVSITPGMKLRFIDGTEFEWDGT